MKNILLSRIQKALHDVSMKQYADDPDNPLVAIEKFDESLSPNMRALRLVANIADQLLSMGTATADVVTTSLGVTDTYCTRRVHLDISSTMLTISQDRGNDREPLTIIRTVVPRAVNYRTVQRLQELVKHIKMHHIALDEAEERFDVIVAKSRLYPRIVSRLSSGGISAGVSALYTDSWFIIALSFIVGFFMSLVIAFLSRKGVAKFFSQIIAATIATLVAGLVSFLSTVEGFGFMADVNPTLIVISGIVLLVAGMMIVSAFQDAIDEYYVTAAARLLQVVMLTGGIVMGVAIGLYLSTRLSIPFTTETNRISLSSVPFQYAGVAIIAGAFALGNQSRLWGILLAAGIGVLAWWMLQVGLDLGLGQIPASGIAAAIGGVGASVASRLWRIPSIATVSASIIPLVPGLTLYNGLMFVIRNQPDAPEFAQGVALLFQAGIVALTIAAGASFGSMVGRPIRTQLIRIKNRLPRRRLHSTQ